MARQPSNSDLAGRLGASLTPRIAIAVARSRSEQNSGLFDVSALYSQALGQVMQRARNEVHLAPLRRLPRAPEPRASSWPAATGVPVAFDLEVPVEFAGEFPVAPARGLGWFGVAVAWLATVTLSAILATSVPAHAVSRLTVRASVTPRTTTTALVQPFVAATSQVGSTEWRPVPVPSAPQAAVATAVVVAVPAGQATVASPLKRLPPPAVTLPRAHVRAVPAVAMIGAAPAAPSPAPSVVVAPVAKSAPANAVVMAPASTAGMSLEDLIRHEVQAESAKKPH